MSFETIRALASELVARATLASRAGLTFGGSRDLYAALGYTRELTPELYHARFKRNGVARRIVRAFPVATWRGGCELIEDEDPDTQTAFELAWAELSTRLNLFPTLQQADILAGLGEYAVVFIGAPGEWHTPLQSGLKPTQVAYLRPLSQRDAQVKTPVTAREDPRYGQPEVYQITFGVPGSGGTAASLVHWTRVIHIPSDDVLDDRSKGTPRLEACWNDLDDLEKVKGGGAEAFWMRADPGMQLKVDPASSMSKEDEDKLSAEVDDYRHRLKRVMKTQGVDIQQLDSNVAMFDKNIDAILKLLSVSSEIPYRILTGSERGQLASEQDDDNWSERVSDRRKGHAEPYALRLLVDRLITHKALPTPTMDGAPGGYVVRWPDQQDLSTNERLAQAEKAASINQKQGETVVTSDEIRDRYLGLPPLEEVDDDEDILVGGDDADPDDDDTEPAEGRRNAVARAAAGRGPSTRFHRAADAHVARVASVVASGFADVRRAVSLTELESAVVDGPVAVERLMMGVLDGFAPAIEADLEERLHGVLLACAGAAAVSTPRVAADGMRASAEVELVGSFDGTNPEAMRWAQQHAAALVTNVTTETRLAVRAIIQQTFAEGLMPRAAARLMRPLVGLTTRQAQAVFNLRTRLMSAKPGALIKAGRVSVRVPKGGASDAFIQRVSSSYSDRLNRQRAATIARHETMEAGNEGQHQLWRQATERGDLPANILRRPLIANDERLCPICRAMEGQRVGINQPFTLPNGTQKMNPPFHVTCRCSQGIVADLPRRAHAA